MERILLVEPNYKNKYPPIGLMKISSYYKNKGDFVEFHKGLLPQSEVVNYDKVLITTLFTFDFDMCVQTIRYYITILGVEKVYVGGIAATIMSGHFLKEIPNLNIIHGQATSANLLGYIDDENIDLLPLDYDILWDISYEYAAADSYFIYTTRGCPRECDFCAVKTLEPMFYDCNNIISQINNVDERFGIKKQLLIMDNNILYSSEFKDTVEILTQIGFGSTNNKIKKNSNMGYYLKSLSERMESGKSYKNLLSRIKNEFINLNFNRISKDSASFLRDVIFKINNNTDNEIITYIFETKDIIVDFFEKYNYHKISRYVDFNQGLDARLLSENEAESMAKLALKPCRIAFDKLEMSKDYLNAMEAAVKYGIKNFSNYLLYNFEEKPEDLWLRINLNIQFCKKHEDKLISLFSFPMKYASIEHTDRSYVGEHWNKKFLKAINVIINVTSGIVAKEEDFFVRAFGSSEEEFIEILTMPDDFIRYRDFFEEKGFSQIWKKYYRNLTSCEKKELLLFLEDINNETSIFRTSRYKRVEDILVFYSIKKNKVENNELYYLNLMKELNENFQATDSNC